MDKNLGLIMTWYKYQIMMKREFKYGMGSIYSYIQLIYLFIYLLNIGTVLILNRQFYSPHLQLQFTQITITGYFAVALTDWLIRQPWTCNIPENIVSYNTRLISHKIPDGHTAHTVATKKTAASVRKHGLYDRPSLTPTLLKEFSLTHRIHFFAPL